MKLTLNKFGKFKNESFEISDAITLFYGENESGKTTICDALMCLFSNKKTSTITNRYGEDFDIETEPKISPSIKLDPNAYKNLYAIRQSEIIFEMADSKKNKEEWKSKIKKKLFSSDIDIGKIALEVSAECSGKADSAIPAKLKNLESYNDKVKEELDGLRDKANSESSNREELKTLVESIREKEGAKRQKEKEAQELRGLIESKKDAELKSKRQGIITSINKYNKDKDFLEENKALNGDYSKTLDECKSKIDKAEKSIPSLEAQIDSLEKEKPSNESLKARMNKAIADLEELESLLAAAAAKKRKLPKIALLAAAALLSVLLSVFLESPYWLLLMLLPAPFMFIKEKKDPLLADPAKPIRDILESLPEIGGGNIEDNEDASAVKAFVAQCLAKLEEECARKDDEIARLQEELDLNKKDLEDCAKEQDNLFKALGVKDIEDYYNKKSEYDRVSKSNEESLHSLMREAEKLGLKDMEDLEADCNRVLKELDAKGVNPQDYNEMEMHKLQNDLKSLNDGIKEIGEEINSAKGEKKFIEGKLASAGNVHGKIVELESQIAENEEKKKDLTKKKKALGVLLEMLSKMNESNDATFASLSSDARALYNSITGKELSDDAIAMSGFDKAKILVKDKQDEARNVEMLSSSTKDAVYISMRLSILAKVHEEGRVMLLDDPFINFDPKRLKETLSLVRGYSKKYNIPVVIFTKDPLVKDIVSGYEEAVVRDLSEKNSA